jgi:hypothetical protein
VQGEADAFPHDGGIEVRQLGRRPARGPAAAKPLVKALVGEGDQHVAQVAAGVEFRLKALDQGRTAQADVFGADARIGLAELLQQRLDAVRLQVAVEDHAPFAACRGHDLRPVRRLLRQRAACRHRADRRCHQGPPGQAGAMLRNHGQLSLPSVARCTARHPLYRHRSFAAAATPN